jgi:ribosomal protein S18 acetylase RimI-like enzyme
MTQTVLDLSRTGKSSPIQQNMIAYMRLFVGLPGIASHEDADTFWIVSGSGAPGNGIYRANLPADRPEERLDALFEQVGQHIDAIDWMTFPGAQSAELAQRLEARGIPGGPAGNWLWIDLATLGTAPAVSADFHIEQVRDDTKMAEWLAVSEAGFGGTFPCFYDAYARHGYGEEAFSLHYTGYLSDVPVTSGTLLDAGGTASIFDISTPNEYRQQGFGGAITHFLMREIKNRGYGDTWIWASNMARPLYQKLGYADADFGIREHTWRKPSQA